MAAAGRPAEMWTQPCVCLHVCCSLLEGLWFLLGSQRVTTLVQFSPWVSERQTAHHMLHGLLALCQMLALHADEPFGSRAP